jgi:hypothetical protein
VQIKKRMKIESLVNHNHIPKIKTKDVNKANEKEKVFSMFTQMHINPGPHEVINGEGGGCTRHPYLQLRGNLEPNLIESKHFYGACGTEHSGGGRVS